ncbi:hypothetical protein EMIT0P43_10441 [Pseudomonas jessenii]
MLRLITQRRRTGQALTVAKKQRLPATTRPDLAVARTFAHERRGDARAELFEETVHGDLSLGLPRLDHFQEMIAPMVRMECLHLIASRAQHLWERACSRWRQISQY